MPDVSKSCDEKSGQIKKCARFDRKEGNPNLQQILSALRHLEGRRLDVVDVFSQISLLHLRLLQVSRDFGPVELVCPKFVLGC